MTTARRSNRIDLPLPGVEHGPLTLSYRASFKIHAAYDSSLYFDPLSSILPSLSAVVT
ncbi:Hypothetical protein FKW44_020501, partial [Caligus rogercresseyi]